MARKASDDPDRLPRQAMELLRQAEERFHRAVMHAPYPAMIYAEDGQALLVNARWSELSGYGIDDVVSIQNWTTRMQVGCEPWDPADVEALYESSEPLEEGQYQITTREGQRRTWEFVSQPLGRLSDGRRGVLRTAVDVTERRQLEETLWEANQRLMLLVESITDGFFALDGQGRIRYVNERAERTFGRKRGDLIGRDFWVEFPAVKPLGFARYVNEVMRTGRMAHAEIEHPPTGRWFEFHVYPFEDGVSVFFREITQRRRDQRALQEAMAQRQRAAATLDTLLAASPVGMALLDTDLRYIRINEALAAANGIPLERHLGRTVREVLPKELADLSEPPLRQVLCTGQPIVNREFTGRGAGPEIHHALVSIYPVRTPDGELLGLGVTYTDITARRQAEQQLEQARQLLEAVVRASPYPIVVEDLEGVVMLWNPAAEAAFGWLADEVIGRPNPLVPPELKPMAERLRKAVIEGGVVAGRRVPCCCKDGSAVDALLSTTAVRSPDGAVRSLMDTLILQT